MSEETERQTGDDDPVTAWPDGGAFHAFDGLFFTRRDDDKVQIRLYTLDDSRYLKPLYDQTFAAEQWASIVASVARTGETHASWTEALAFHRR